MPASRINLKVRGSPRASQIESKGEVAERLKAAVC